MRSCRVSGSSPRVRGTLRHLVQPFCLDRFIPARAGNAPPSGSALLSGPVHPRACGERLECHAASLGVGGSSPRVRGTLRLLGGDHASHRFIPAACGERVVGQIDLLCQFGSSPRVRGTLVRRAFKRCAGRFIPARAGNAGPTTCARSTPTVHPRACGERPLPWTGCPSYKFRPAQKSWYCGRSSDWLRWLRRRTSS